MSDFIGYKQHIEHVNIEPDLKNKICNISNIVTHTKVINNKKQYYFDVVVNKEKSITRIKHSYYFDDLNQAKNMYLKTRTKFYDQETKPYLTKIEKGKKLTKEDKEKILKIIDSF